MNHAEKDIDLIERFYEDGLSEYEADLFERRLKSDDAFRALVEQEKYVVGAIRMQGLKDELEQLKLMEATLRDPVINVPHPVNRRWYILAAAVIALVIVARFAIAPPVTTESLYKENFRPYPNVFEPTVRGQGAATDRDEAFKLYEKGDYARAGNLFRALLQEENNDGILLLLGNCNLALGNTNEAVSNFSQLQAQSPELTIQAKWFLSMAYLQKGDAEAALPLLKELSTTGGSYAEKAQEMVRKLTP